MNRCPKCGIEYEGNFCPNGCSSAPATPPPPTDISSPTPPAAPVPPATVKKQPKNLLSYIIIAMLAVNIVLTGVSMFLPSGGGSSARSVEEQRQSSKEYEAYQRKVGQNVQLTNVQVETSDYGSSKLTGYAKNISNSDLETVSIDYSFYQGTEFVDSATTYISRLPKGSSVKFSIYVPDEACDSYELYSVEASYAN